MVSERPDALAVIDEHRSLTFAELDRRANGIADALRERSIGPEGLVGVALERSVELMVALLGIWKAGAAYLPLDPDYPPERLSYMIGDSEVPVVLTHPPALGSLPEGNAEVLDVSSVEGTSTTDARPTRADQLAYVIYTSGSTGRPKGAMIEHGAIANRIRWQQRTLPIGPGDMVLQKTPTSFDVSVWELFWSLSTGASLFLAAPGGHRDNGYLARVIAERGVTVCHFVPSMLAAFLDAPGVERCDGVLRHVVSSGEALPANLVRRFAERLPNVTLHNLYGPTEAAVDVTHWPVDPAADTIPIGRAIDGVELHVVDPETGEPVRDGTEGELWIGGVQVGRGYLKRPELTAERFLPNPFGEGRVYRTGDRVSRSPSGDLLFHGRFDHQVKLRGFRIELGEIEARLREHPAVRDAVLVVRDDGPSPQLVAYATPRSEPEPPASSVEVWAEVFDAAYATPRGDEGFDIASWKSSYTGEPIPEAEMRRWLDGTLARLRALGPTRVLELGCGTGMLLHGLAESVERYVGLDLSERAIRDLRAQANRRGWDHVELKAAPAHAIADYADDEFDLVLVNSVLMYFPGPRYLRSLVEHGRRVTADGGHLFFGDVRSLPELAAFHESVQRHRADQGTSEALLRTRTLGAMAAEEELVVDPRFFASAGEGFGGVEVLWRRGRDANEMTRFRYDAVLHVGPREGHPAPPEPEPWAGLEAIGEGADHRRVIGLPNDRTTAGGIDPEDAIEAAEAAGYRARAAVSPKPGTFELLLDRGPRSLAPSAPTPSEARDAELTSDPNRGTAARTLRREWRATLQATLPDYMVPSALVVLPAMPLSPSGKVDRRALPPPDRQRRTVPPVAATNATEEAIAALWKETLGVETVGVHDNFFDLGGDSIVALQIAAKAREVGLALSPAVLFAHHTIAELATVVGERGEVQAEQGQVSGEQTLTAMQRWTLDHAPAHPDRTGMITRLRLRRPVDLAQLRRAADAVVAHHDALRLSFTRTDEGWTARYGEGGLAVVAGDGPFDTGLDLAEGPVGRLWVEGTEPGDRVTLVLHHMVADGISLRLVLGDLERALDAIEAGEEPELPSKSTSFRYAAERFAALAEGAARGELPYWESVLAHDHAPLPGDPEVPDLERSEGAIERSLEPEETRALLTAAPKALGARVDDLLLAALAWGLSRWTGGARFCVDTESHGREAIFDEVDLSRTVGVFSALYPVSLPVGADPFETLREVQGERRAIPRNGLGFGLLRWITEAPSLVGAPHREIAFNFMGRLDRASDDARFEPITGGTTWARAPDEPRAHPLIIEARVVDGRFFVRFGFAGERFSEGAVATAADGMIEALRAMVRRDASSAARFPLCPLDDDALAAVAGDAALDDVYPTAPLQDGLLLHTALEPESGVYRVQIGGRVPEELDEDRLCAAWEGLVEAHPILRTRFVTDAAVPTQLVHAEAAPTFAVSDWRDEDEAAETHARQLARSTYAMSAAGLTALEAARLDGAFRLFWDFHHVLLDGWSMMELLEELLARYREPDRAFRERPLYRDYVAWALERRGDPESEACFRRMLGSVRAATPLPADGGEPFEGPDPHAKTLIALDPAPLVALAKRERVTLNTVAQAAWAIALTHWSGQSDVVFGAVVPGRPASLTGAARMVGLLMNTLPVRATVEDAPLGDWLRAQQAQMVELLEHEHMPLGDAQRLASLEPGTPLISSVISVQGYLRGADSLGGWAKGLGVEELTFVDWNDLPLSVAIEAGESFAITIKHDRRRFSAKAAARIADDVRTVFESIATATDAGSLGQALAAKARERRRAGARGGARSGPKRRRSAPSGPSRPGPKRRGPSRQRKALPSDRREWVTVAPMAEHGAPHVVSPVAPVDLAGWASEQRDYVEALLAEHRALLFRGFGVDSVEPFERFVAATSNGEPLAYRDRTTPRTTKGTGVYTSTVHPADQTIRLHNEGTYWRRWAQKLYFACTVAADEGGATPVADVRKVYERIDPAIREAFAERGMMLLRNYNDGFGLPWQEVFQTDSKAEVEAFCRANDILFEWKSGDRLLTKSIRPAIRRHPRTGEPLWFNHVAFYHHSSMDPSVREALVAELGIEGLPYGTYYGDGEPIEEEVAAALRAAYEAEKIAFPWEAGDVMLLDNMTFAHGRQPYRGEREVLVAMTEPVGDDDLPELQR